MVSDTERAVSVLSKGNFDVTPHGKRYIMGVGDNLPVAVLFSNGRLAACNTDQASHEEYFNDILKALRGKNLFMVPGGNSDRNPEKARGQDKA